MNSLVCVHARVTNKDVVLACITFDHFFTTMWTI